MAINRVRSVVRVGALVAGFTVVGLVVSPLAAWADSSGAQPVPAIGGPAGSNFGTPVSGPTTPTTTVAVTTPTTVAVTTAPSTPSTTPTSLAISDANPVVGNLQLSTSHTASATQPWVVPGSFFPVVILLAMGVIMFGGTGRRRRGAPVRRS